MRICKKAYAKINLCLDVKGKREDGYHLVRMVMQTVNLYDKLEFCSNETGEIRLQTGKASLAGDRTNLIWKACERMRELFSIRQGLDIKLDKKIPMAAGMAGGSADAAATFLAMNEMFDLHLSMEELRKIALPLGADIPFCIEGGTMLSEGIGEVLTPLCAPPEAVLLVAKPAVNVSTKEVYAGLDRIPEEKRRHPDVDRMVEALKAQDLSAICALTGNSLEEVTKSMHPVISEIEEVMRRGGALTQMMSGSGPSVFGIFRDAPAAQRTFYELKQTNIAPELFLTSFIRP